MESSALQQRIGVNASDLIWSRILEILNNDTQVARRSGMDNAPQGLIEVPALNSQSPASLMNTSPPRLGSPDGGDAHALQDFFLAAGPSAAHQHQHQHQHQQTYPHQQERLPQPASRASTSSSLQPRSLFLLGQLNRRAQAAAAAAASYTNTMHGPNLDSDSVSASAERHRLTSEATGIRVQMFVDWIADLIPFLFLFTWIFFFSHAGALLLFVFLSVLIIAFNGDIRRLIALRTETHASTCVSRAVAITALTFLFGLFTWPDTRVLKVLTLRTIQAASAMDTLCLIILADSLLRFGSLALKLMVVAWFRSKHSGLGTGNGSTAATFWDDGGGSSYLSGAKRQRQQSRVLTAVERAVALYRTLVPGPAWYGYLLRGGGYSPVLASLFCGFYLALKASYVLAQTRLFALALKMATRRGPLYGTYVGRVDASEGTFGACPVCQDPVNSPVRLDCGHIFCEECILEWLERDRTCPMCRAEVRPAGLPSCSDGASPLFPQLF